MNLWNYLAKSQVLSILTPKIPSVFGPIFAVSDLVGGFHFSTQKKCEFEEVTVGS
jgi:hypothetical protein